MNENDEIHPMFKEKLDLNFEQTVDDNLEHLPPTHPIFNDIWRRIDKYEDKQFIYDTFKEEENKDLELLKTYDYLIRLRKLNDEHEFFKKMQKAYRGKYDSKVMLGEMSGAEAKAQFFGQDFYALFSDILTEEDADILYIIDGDPEYTSDMLEEHIERIGKQVHELKEYSFAEEIYKRYIKGKKPTGISVKLKIDVRNIIKDKKRIESNYNNMIVNDQPPKFDIQVKHKKEDKVRMEVCKLLEKHLNLIKNPKDDRYYISDGQGKYIPFDESTSRYTYEPLREQFFVHTNTKDGPQEEEIVWSKGSFFKLAEQFSINESQVEENVVGFRNCYLNLKEKKIYKLDHRFPHLPIKDLSKNFVYNHELDGGAIETILNECFTDQDRDILLQYFGRALFEKGYTQSQDVVFFLGAGELGKTTFISSLAQIFKNVPLIEANKFDVDNQFAFAEIPGADFVIIDEIQSMKKKGKFTEKIKQFTGGSNHIPIERKNKNVFQLPAEYIPRIIGIGNDLPGTVYEKFAGRGVVRRFCIIFAKRSILKAKRMTTIINNIEYPITEDGHILGLTEEERYYDEDGELWGVMYDKNFQPILDKSKDLQYAIQGRTKFKQEELMQDGCLEWFIQQIILNFREDDGALLPIEEARERAFMAFSPESWSIHRNFEVRRTSSGLDDEYKITPQQLLDIVRKDIDSHLLEHTVTNIHDAKFDVIVETALHLEEDNFKIYEDGKLMFIGIERLSEPKPFNIDDVNQNLTKRLKRLEY